MTNAPRVATRWFYCLAPSVADLFFIAILFSLTCGPFAVRLLGDAGIGWHIRDGQQILQTRAIPRTDPFSVTMGGRPWYAWEWLYDLVIAAIHRWLGLNGVVFFTALVIAATFSVVLRWALNHGGGLPVTMALLILTIGPASIHFLARPHVLSWLLGVVWFWLLDADCVQPRRRKFHPLFWYPLLMLLWANLHGGFLLGFLLLIIYALGLLIQNFVAAQTPGRGVIRLKLEHLGAAALLSFLASLVNPYSYRLYIHIYRYLTDRFLMDHIDEFLSPNFHDGAQQCFAGLLLIALVAIAAGRGRIHPARVLVIVFAAYTGLYSSRNLPLSSILLTLIIAPLLSEQIETAGENPKIAGPLRASFARLTSFSNRMTTVEAHFRGHLWPVIAIISGIAICVHGGRIGNQQWMSAQFSAKRFPVQATNFIAERGIADPIFCPDYWGGYLIYRLYPKSKVFIDDRHDLYGDKFLQQYLQVIHVGPAWNDVLNRWQVNWVLAPTQSSLANILRESSQWTRDYEDGTAVLFRRVQK